VPLLPAINYCRCHEIDENTGQGLITGVNDTNDNLSPGIVDTGEQLIAGGNQMLALIIRLDLIHSKKVDL
jgi:hypothetical protein